MTLPVQEAGAELVAEKRPFVLQSLQGLAPLEAHRRVAELLLFGTASVLRQLRRAKVSTALVGGNLRPPPGVVRLGVTFGRLIDRAVGELAARGHRKVFIPFLRREKAAPEATAELRAIEQRHGVRIIVHWSQLIATRPEEMEAQLQRAFAAGATAILFPQWGDFVLSMGFPVRHGLQIPRDYSVVVLNNVSEGVRFRPALAGFQVPVPEVRRTVLTWLRESRADAESFAQRMLETWIPGETLGQVPLAQPAENFAI